MTLADASWPLSKYTILIDVQVQKYYSGGITVKKYKSQNLCFMLPCGIDILAFNPFVQVFSLSDMSYGLENLCVLPHAL